MIFGDFETRSEVNVKNVGSYLYSRHPSTEIICLCYSYNRDYNPVHVWHPDFEDLSYLQAQRKRDRTHSNFERSPDPTELLERVDAGELFEAHGAHFERCIWRWIMVERYGWPAVQDWQWRCSASAAAAFALRRKLADVCSDLGLSQRKDMEGHKVMLKLTKPRKPTKPDPDSKWHQKRKDVLKVMKYCVQDVRSERAVSHALRPLSGTELEIWQLDQTINFRGLRIDRALATKALEVGALAEAAMRDQLSAVTYFAVEKETQREKFKEWLRSRGTEVPTKLKKEIDEAGNESFVEKETTEGKALRKMLKSVEDQPSQRAIELWLALNKTSTKKYRAMINRMDPEDDRVREAMRYHAATTGRWGGAGIQPHNLPRKCPKDIDGVCADVLQFDYEDLCLLYGHDNIMTLLSSILRGAIIAAPGHDLLAADYSAIEARGTAWVAGDKEMLQAFIDLDNDPKADWDIYTWTASQMYGRRITKADEEERGNGKIACLGCGYQMGGGALVNYADGMGIELTAEQSDKIVRDWREARWRICEFWYGVQRAAMSAVRRPGKLVEYGPVRFKVLGRFLHCRLPSGRLLSYLDPRIDLDEKFKRPALHFTGYATYAPNLWIPSCKTYGGKLTENIVQALCRDIMAEAMLRAESAGYPIILTVHDEIVAEVPKGQGSLEEFKQILNERPKWALDFPIAASGWRAERYRK